MHFCTSTEIKCSFQCTIGTYIHNSILRTYIVSQDRMLNNTPVKCKRTCIHFKLVRDNNIHTRTIFPTKLLILLIIKN